MYVVCIDSRRRVSILILLPTTQMKLNVKQYRRVRVNINSTYMLAVGFGEHRETVVLCIDFVGHHHTIHVHTNELHHN